MGKKKRKIITALLTALLSCGFISAAVQPMETQADIVIKTNNSDTSSKTFTGIKKENGVYKVFKNGSVNTAFTGLNNAPDGKWYYFAKGVHDPSYTGLAKSTNGKFYYVKNGIWDTTYTGFAKYTDGKWYFVKNGRYDTSYTGLAYSEPSKGWFYSDKGVYNNKYTGIAKSTDSKMYYAKNGRWDTSYTGLAQYTDGKWYYVKDGRHQTYTGVCKSTNGLLYYAKNGVWDTSYTGLAQYHADGKWYFVKNGRHEAYTGVCKSTNGLLYYAKNGVWDTSYTGLAQYHADGKWYFVKNGRHEAYTGVCKSTNGLLYYAKNGLWDTSYTGLAQYHADGKWYYVKNGRHEAYTGFAKNINGWWYVEKGVVTLKKNGNIKGNVDGISSTWIVKNSRVEGENKTTPTHTHSYTTPVYKTVHHNEKIDDSKYETNVVTYAGQAVYMFSHGAYGMGQKDTIVQHYNSCDEALEAYTYITGEKHYRTGRGLDCGYIPGLTIDPATGKSIKDEKGDYKYPKLWISPAFNYKLYLNNCPNGTDMWVDWGTCIIAYKPQKITYRKITPAYDEKILTGHKCSCGAVKDTTHVSQTKAPATQTKTIIKDYDILWYHQYPNDFKTFIDANPEFKKHASLTTVRCSDEAPGPENTNIYNYYKTYPYMKDYKGYGPDSYLKTHSGEAALNANKTIH